jgi:hypothetical protein
MNRANRAAQFQPFDALKGLQEELRMREERRNRVAKKEVSEEKSEEISRELIKVEKGSNVEIVFYRSGRYYELAGCVLAKNDTYKYLMIGEEKIPYDDIYVIKVE